MRTNNRRRVGRRLAAVVAENTQAETCRFYDGSICDLIRPNDLICKVKRCSLWIDKNQPKGDE